MKNIFRFLMAVAVLFTASCAKEDISSSIGGGEVEVTFTANHPELSSRAYGEGSEITTLRYEVYSNDERLGDLCGTTGITAAPITVNLVLIKGMSYDILFWADNGSDLYTINNGVVSFSAQGIQANDESRDAFYAAVKGFNPADANADTTIELYRPFAQLNAKVTNMDEVNKSITVTSTTISTKIYTTFNPFAENENEVVGGLTAEPVTFTATTMTAEDLVAGHLSMNYLLAPAGGCVADVTFTFNNDKNVPISGTTYTNVPLKANYRTNIIGALLTNSTDFTVEIKPAFNQPDQEPEELFMAAVLGGEVTLTEDVVLTQPLKVESKMTINLNGKTISNTGGYAIENYGELTISGNGNFEGLGGIRSHAGKLTINGGNYTCSSNWNNGTFNHILKAENSEVVINGGTFDATIGGTTNAMINVSENSVVTINGGTFKNVDGTIPQFAPYMFTYEKNGKLIINDGDFYGGWRFNGETATTDIYGGKFTVSYDGQSFHATSTHVVTIYGGVFSLENGGKLNPANHLAAGYKAVLIDSWYRVLPEVIADAAVAANVTAVTESTADVATALANNNGEVTMFMWNDVAYIAKYGEVVITSAADEATTVRGVVESAAGLTSATVAEGVKVVGNRTFRQCANLETVALPNTLTEIGPAVFQSCSKLANVTIPASVTTIGEGAFAECTSLTSINIPEGITRLEKDVLRNTGLVSIEIPASVNYIGAQAFRDCKQLKEVVINAPEFTMEGNTFGIMAAPFTPMTIYVANAEMKAYVASKLTDHAKTYITVVAPEAVSNAERLTEALANGENVTLTQDIEAEAATTAPYGNKYAFKLDGGVLDGNGHELNMECYGDDYGIMTSGGTIKNLTIKEGCRAVMIMYPQQDIILDNVKIGGDGVLYPINTGEGGADGVDLIVTNSVLAGWTSYGLIASASFTNVEFKQGTYYNNIYGRVLKPYVNTTITDCSFVAHMNLDLSSLTSGHKITFKNCTVDGQAINAGVFTVPTTNAQYDTELFTVDLPSWATSINDCIVFE